MQHDLVGAGSSASSVRGRGVLIKYLSCVILSHVCHLPLKIQEYFFMINA